MTPGSVVVHLVKPAEIAAEAAVGCLTVEEKGRAARFHFKEDADTWIACRAALRRILGEAIDRSPVEVPLVFSEFGKPSLAPPHDSLQFNLSHCPGLAMIALCHDGPVGVDLEPLDRASGLLGCEDTFCHPAEIKNLPVRKKKRASRLLQIWTTKEAALKALGTGLSHPPETVQILFGDTITMAVAEPPIRELERFQLHRLSHPALFGYQAVVCAPKSVFKVEIR